jgi:hypothetical protein
MTVWREGRVLALLAFAAGAGAGWAVDLQYDLLRGLTGLAIAAGGFYALCRWRGMWAWAALPLLVPAGWFGGVPMADWALVVVILLFGIPLWATLWLGRWRALVAVAGPYAVLAGAIVLGAAPPWCALGVLTAPLVQLAARGSAEMGSVAWREALFALNGQVLMGFFIEGMVR